MDENNNGDGGKPNPQGNDNGGNDAPKNEQPVTFDAWLTSQDATIKGLIDGHVTGLKSALDSERNERKNLAKQIGDLKGKAEKGSELEKQLETLNAQLEAQSTKAAFYESAPADVANMRLAWMAAQDGHTDRKGNVDWASLRTAYPELFRKQAAPNANAGNGRGQEGGNQQNMNNFIRSVRGG